MKLAKSLRTVSILSALVIPLHAHSSALELALAGGEVAASALTGETIESVIESTRREAQQLLAESERTGNVLLTRAADELNLLADNTSRMFEGHLNTAFEELDQDKQDILLGLANAAYSANKLADKAYTLKDTMALDVRSILGDVPFVKEKLVLQRIDGLSIIKGKPNYELEVLGSYIGLPGEGYRTALSLSMNGQEVSGVDVDPQEIHKATLRIPLEAIAPYFDDKKASRLPVTLNVKQMFDKPLWGFLWDVEETKEYSANLNMTLYPDFAGVVDVTTRHKVYGWKPSTPIERSMTHSDHCSKHCGDHYGTVYDVSVTVNGNSTNPKVGDKRIKTANCNRVAGTSGYSVHLGTQVTADLSKAICRIRFRTRPQTYTLHAEIEEYGVIEEKDITKPQELYFEKLTEVKVPKNTTTILFKGRLITGELVDTISTEINAASPIKIVSKVNNENDDSLYLRATRPPEL